ncbi:hypothetical protein EKK58_06850 [Candidatus Dependentiae bacterium]|nr:MAG: hypothetical protein EKK58_06850 [Candidatus Dependentiae bacterium]
MLLGLYVVIFCSKIYASEMTLQQAVKDHHEQYAGPSGEKMFYDIFLVMQDIESFNFHLHEAGLEHYKDCLFNVVFYEQPSISMASDPKVTKKPIVKPCTVPDEIKERLNQRNFITNFADEEIVYHFRKLTKNINDAQEYYSASKLHTLYLLIINKTITWLEKNEHNEQFFKLIECYQNLKEPYFIGLNIRCDNTSFSPRLMSFLFSFLVYTIAKKNKIAVNNNINQDAPSKIIKNLIPIEQEKQEPSSQTSSGNTQSTEKKISSWKNRLLYAPPAAILLIVIGTYYYKYKKV